MVSLEDIKKNPDKVLSDNKSKMEIVNNSELAVEVLKSKGIYKLEVEVDGKPIYFVRSPERPAMWNNLFMNGKAKCKCIK